MQISWGPDYEYAGHQLTIEQALRATIDMGREPLLWSYAAPDANYTELKFGFDEHIEGQGKIGHVALTQEATISGEIFRNGAAWKINNDSGAWGNMGGHDGKSQLMLHVANFMSNNCGMVVTAEYAYSRNAVKRWFQKTLGFRRRR
ncbi:hypothetical protein [Desulfosarcina ovata]|uniref:Uncharacterized protein n=2 Tax=Desulfosarcina ovata TaxID=83564 RepID=A0A5K8AEL4_9BACT|nr:hypothetical protein [Desulfosarcina ovata]BBO84538.1 hypothetical protein DSCO28_51040 [Desulfosarcina ovata subsp. sediminis]BBO91011.1 hypothetical protein DSCOOX_41910 [Desulfosarcina ovata subsp. ovata]